MLLSDALVLYDISAVVLLLLLASLSKRLGEALKVPPYYNVLYGSAICMAAAFCIDLFDMVLALRIVHMPSWVIPSTLRCVGTISGLLVSLVYWRWLFGELFKK
jgi:hypothetical protein